MILHGGCMNEFRDFLTMDADARPVWAGIGKLDVPAFRDFLARVYQRALPDADAERIRLLQDMNLATEEGFLNLACALLFTAHPEWIVPQFPVRAARFRGNTVHAFLERQNVEGPLPGIYRECHAFIMRHLHRIEAVRGITAPDAPEIPPVVFEELLVNALVHRDYSLSAPVRLFIFDNRVEIASPGHLPGNRTLENIRAGISSLRNPILLPLWPRAFFPIMAWEQAYAGPLPPGRTSSSVMTGRAGSSRPLSTDTHGLPVPPRLATGSLPDRTSLTSEPQAPSCARRQLQVRDQDLSSAGRPCSRSAQMCCHSCGVLALARDSSSLGVQATACQCSAGTALRRE